MNEIIYENWVDEIDIRNLEENGEAVLRRKYLIGNDYAESYPSHPEKAPIVAKGVTAFLFGNTYFGGLQLPPINTILAKGKFNISDYFERYYSIHKKRFNDLKKTEPDYVHSNSDKRFLRSHIKAEISNLKFSKEYFNNPKYDKTENNLKKAYALSYIKWIKSKGPLTFIDKVELGYLSTICLLILLYLFFSFSENTSPYNFALRINQLIDHSKGDTTKEIGKYISSLNEFGKVLNMKIYI